MYWNHTITDYNLYTYEYFQQEDVCRLCWNKNASTELFNENTENSTKTSLLEIIKECLEIDLLHMIPNKLCESCSSEIKRFYSYKKFCRETDKKLQEIFEKGLNEASHRVFEYNVVKDEVIDDNFDKLEDFLDDTVKLEEPEPVKKLMSHSRFRKKYQLKRSATYCNLCCLDLESKEQLSSHNSELHGIENNGTSFRCFGCEKRFKSGKTRLSHELNFCKGLKDGYKCGLCNRYLPKRCMYEYHMRDHRHNTLTDLPEHLFECTKCVKLFNTKELLRKHIIMEHDKGKNFVCDICGRVFIRQDYLHKHRLTHTGTKRHQCPHCDFKATQKSSLTVHIRKHTGERPYSCDMCPQKCISSSNLRAHRRRHLGVKKYECNICSKKFGYKISLEEHISSTHVRCESHPCEHCGATYTRIRGLRRHLAAKHGKQEKTKDVEPVETNVLGQVTEETGNKIQIIKDVKYELKDSENVLLLKHQDGDVYMV